MSDMAYNLSLTHERLYRTPYQMCLRDERFHHHYNRKMAIRVDISPWTSTCVPTIPNKITKIRRNDKKRSLSAPMNLQIQSKLLSVIDGGRSSLLHWTPIHPSSYLAPFRSTLFQEVSRMRLGWHRNWKCHNCRLTVSALFRILMMLGFVGQLECVTSMETRISP